MSDRERDHELRIAELEQKVALLMRHIGIEAEAAAPPAHRAEVESLVRQGRKIDAIKVWREATGDGLRDAKEAVEDLQRRLR